MGSAEAPGAEDVLSIDDDCTAELVWTTLMVEEATVEVLA
jgi:hypothetical protein